MNILVKSAVAGALALGATGAFAMGVPNTNSSNLVLVVENLATNATYALDTGISIDSILPTSGIVKGDVLATTMSGLNQAITQSPALQSFFAANPAAGDSWTLEAGQYNGGGINVSTLGNSNPVGAAKMIFASAIGTTTNQVVSGLKLANLVAFENGVNTDFGTGGLLSALQTSTETSGANLYTTGPQQKYGAIGAPDMTAVGTASQLFGFTGSATTGTLTSYILGSAILGTDGTLTISAVPLPAAVWLFGSGLMGLVGVSRRRKAAV